MSEILIVIQREFRERVRSRSFLLSTILTPLVFAAAFLLPPLLAGERGDELVRIVVVDETSGQVGGRVVELLSPTVAADERTTFWVDHVTGPSAGLADSLAARIEADEIDGYLWLPEDFVARGQVRYRAEDVADPGVLERLQSATSQAAHEERLGTAGLQIAEVAALMQPVAVETSRVTADTDEAEVSESTMIFAYLLSFVLYLIILLYGMQVMQSVQEERTNRIAEVLMSSISAPELMAGKIFGVGAAALLQVSIWAAMAAVVISRPGWIAGMLDIPVDLLGGFEIGAGAAAMLVLYTLLGFFLYAAIFAAVGAATDSVQDAQYFTWVIIMPLVAPMILQTQIIDEPNAPLATALGWVPLTSPIVMPMRMGAAAIPAWEIAGSLLALVLGLAFAAWTAGKIYRVGILSTGKRASFGDLWRWVRTA